jgi:phosphoglycerate dehydrogenase-like enzyme
MSDALSIVTDFAFSAEDQRLLREAAGPTGRVEVVSDVAALRRALPGADVLCTFRPPSDIVTLAPRLRWLQYPGAGVDNLIREGVLHGDQPFTVTTVSSANAQAIAEYIFGAMLIFARKWDDMLRLQLRKEWAQGRAWGALRGFELGGRTLGIVGLGAIGRRAAGIARGFRMRVLGMRRTAQEEWSDPDCDTLYRPDQLHDLLGESDIVVISVPLTNETQGLIGEAELRAMRPNALLINVARGEVVQEAALIRALRERWIAGAALDVTEEEPLARTSPLWDLPGVLVTPHMSGLTTGYATRVAQLFAENIRRFLRGDALLNLVDLARGY